MTGGDREGMGGRDDGTGSGRDQDGIGMGFDLLAKSIDVELDRSTALFLKYVLPKKY